VKPGTEGWGAVSNPLMRPNPIIAPLLAGWLLGAAALLTASAVSAATDSSIISSELPDMGTPADAIITKSDEYQLGRMIVRGLRDQNEVLEDPELSDYMQHLGSKLAAQTRIEQSAYQYFVVRDQAINAFALPGGFIGVNAGLILLTNNESELASVMAHETAHVRQRHIARAAQAQAHASLASTAAMLAAILIGAASGNSQVAMGGIAMGQGIALQKSINFTRSEEAEADRVGIGYLADAGFNTAAMPTFFEEMQRREGVSDSGPLDLLRSHPVTSERIAETRSRAQQYARNSVTESELYPWMRERLRVVSADETADMRIYYSRLRDRRPLTDAERYGEALAQLRQHDESKAVPTLRELLAANGRITALYASLGTALQQAGLSGESIQTFERALKLFPRNVPISVRYAEALLKAGKPKPAHELLLDLFNNEEPTPDQIKLTALVASAAGDTGDAYYYMAEYHLSGGDLALANSQLELALAAPNLSSVQRKRFRARLEEIRDWIREERLMHPGNRGSSGG
jgi:predicted Zn-dependent protease